MDDDKETKQKMAFDELKKRMKSCMENEMYEDDSLFYRFLIARDFKVEHSEAMLKQHLEWRKKNDIKNIFKFNMPEIFEKYFHLVDLGYDKEGGLVKYNHFGNTDYRGIFESCTVDDWYKCLIYYFEEDILKLKRKTQELGKVADKVSYVVNLENFSLAKATDKKVISNMILSINLYLDNYPETMKAVYAINAPVYFSLFFRVITAFLPSTVLKKIKIYSDDSWKKDILDVVDAEVLPAFLEGKRTDPDGNPLCLTLIPQSELVPKKFYFNKSKRPFPTLEDGEKINISRASFREIYLEVREPGSHIEWEFEVKSGDIKFGLFFNDEAKKAELVPLRRINTNVFTESGLYKCEISGSYIILFDNTYSFLQAKEVCYKIAIKKPQEQISS